MQSRQQRGCIFIKKGKNVMKKASLKKILSVLIVFTMIFAMCVTASADEKYTVAICQLVQHAALDAATLGFRDALTDALGDSVEFDEQNASGDISTCAVICNNFAASDVDLILANATPALQAAVAATDEIPILGTAITEYGVALDIDNFDGTVGGNVSGTSDLAPLDQQAQMIVDLFPDAKTVAILYCSAEANSVYQAEVVKAELEKNGIIESGLAFWVQSKLYDCRIETGTYTVNSRNSSKEIIKYLNQEYLKAHQEEEP